MAQSFSEYVATQVFVPLLSRPTEIQEVRRSSPVWCDQRRRIPGVRLGTTRPFFAPPASNRSTVRRLT